MEKFVYVLRKWVKRKEAEDILQKRVERKEAEVKSLLNSTSFSAMTLNVTEVNRNIKTVMWSSSKKRRLI